MRLYYSIFVLAVILSSLFLVLPALSQEQAVQENPPQVTNPVKEEAPGELSIYGEVQSVNQAAGSMTVQYYDYDSDEEKPIELILNKDTKIENAATPADIKGNDWVDVTYSVIEGKNVAKSVTVEKEEPVPEEEAAAGKAAEEMPDER